MWDILPPQTKSLWRLLETSTGEIAAVVLYDKNGFTVTSLKDTNNFHLLFLFSDKSGHAFIVEHKVLQNNTHYVIFCSLGCKPFSNNVPIQIVHQKDSAATGTQLQFMFIANSRNCVMKSTEYTVSGNFWLPIDGNPGRISLQRIFRNHQLQVKRLINWT